MFRELSDMEFADLDPEKRQEYLLGQTLNHQAQTAKWMKIVGVIVCKTAFGDRSVGISAKKLPYYLVGFGF